MPVLKIKDAYVTAKWGKRETGTVTRISPAWEGPWYRWVESAMGASAGLSLGQHWAEDTGVVRLLLFLWSL